MKKWLKRVMPILLILALSISTIAVAAEDDSVMSEQAIEAYALDFMRQSLSDNSISVNEFLPLYDLDDNVTGYYVTFDKSGDDAGYVLISLLAKGCPIVEFNFEGAGPLSVVEQVPLTASLSSTYRVIYTGPNNLFVPLNNGKFLDIYSNGTLITTQEIVNDYTEYLSSDHKDSEIAPYNDIEPGIIDWGSSNVNASTVFKLPSFGSGSDYWLMSDFGGGEICAPTAATNILWYWGMQRGCSSVTSKVAHLSNRIQKAAFIYSECFEGMGTNPSTGTFIYNVTNGYRKFFGCEPSAGGVWNVSSLRTVSYDPFVNALNENCPIHLNLDKNSDKHAVFAIGHALSNTGTKYIFVMDGWNPYGRFVKFDYFGIMSGYKIWVKE